jgi:hypothetical protein
MSRLFGYYKKLLNDMEALRKSRGVNSPGAVADAMRHHAETGEYPSNHRLRGMIKRMQLTALQMAKTVPPPPPPDGPGEEAQELPLSETFTSEDPEWVVQGGNVTAIRKFV